MNKARLKLYKEYKFSQLNQILKTILFIIPSPKSSVLMSSQHITFSLNHPSIQQIDDLPNNSTQIVRKLKKKLTSTFQKIPQQQTISQKNLDKLMKIYTQSKVKVLRKDTSQTDQVSVSNKKQSNLHPNDDQIRQLILKSEKDPFLRKKLKYLMQNELKSLKKLNQKSSSMADLHVRTMPCLKQERKPSELNTSEIIESEYRNIPKDISIVLSSSMLLKRDFGKKSGELSDRSSFEDFSNQEQKMLIENQMALKQPYTTLRKQLYKNKVSRLQSLKQLQQNQEAVTKMALDKFIDRTNLSNNEPTKRTPGRIKK